MTKKQPAPRRRDQLRPIRFTRGFTDFAAGSVLVEMGQTRVLCTASLLPEVPKWRDDDQLGWVTADYTMLPSSTPTRKPRPRTGSTDSRGTEIQRLIGRALRAVVDFSALGPNTIYLDCDVLQADGGTRTAAINGAYVAMVDAVKQGRKAKLIPGNPLRAGVAAVSVGIVDGKPALDLDYAWDSCAEVDMNVVMTDAGEFIEIQGTGEQGPFSAGQLDELLGLAQRGIKKITAAQRTALRR